jgi:hypothetical protein
LHETAASAQQPSVASGEHGGASGAAGGPAQNVKRYLVASRSGPQLSPESSGRLEQLAREGVLKEVRQTPLGRRVVEMPTERAAELSGSDPDLMIEEDVRLNLS